MLGIVGCGEDDDNDNGVHSGPYLFDPSDPNDANISGIDWAVVATNYGSYNKENTNSGIFVVPMYDSIWTQAYPFVNSISLVISGDTSDYTVDLTLLGYDGFYMPIWFGEVNITEGAVFPFTLNVTELNNTAHTYTANLMTTYSTDTFTYPNYFVPGETLNFSWTLPASNQYQIASAESYYYNWVNDTEYIDEYSVELSNTLRTFTFPANCVTNYGDDTDYCFCIDQYNQTINGRFLAISSYSDYMDYYTVKGDITMEQHILRLIKTLKLR
jgi:hypothetical protein